MLGRNDVSDWLYGLSKLNHDAGGDGLVVVVHPDFPVAWMVELGDLVLPHGVVSVRAGSTES